MIIPFLAFYVKRMLPEADEGERTLWIGAILTAQYSTSVFGAGLLGLSSDIFGRKVALLQSMTGDVVFFALSGAVAHISIPIFVAMRALAGLMIPIVPATAWLVDAISHMDPSEQAPALAKLSASLMGGMMTGNAVSIAISAAGGGIEASCFAGSVFSFFVVLVVARQPRVACRSVQSAEACDAKQTGGRPKGVGRLVRMPRFLALVLDSISNGFVFGSAVTLLGEVLVTIYDWSETSVSVMYATVTFIMVAWSIVLYRAIVGKLGLRVLVVACNATISAAALGVAMSYEKSEVAFVLLMPVTILSVGNSMPSLNALATEYADTYTVNARGTVLGLARAAFSIGQAMSPICAAALYAVDKGLPFVLVSALNLASGLAQASVFVVDAKQQKRSGASGVAIAPVKNAGTSDDIAVA